MAIDLFCGAFGWSAGLVAEGWCVVGFDIDHQPYHGPVPEYCQLVLQDVLTLHGSQFKDAALIVASPPCQAYSYRAMPWKKAKALPPPDNALFEACFRIQGEASAAAGRHIPMVVENVCGAQKWVGRARWHWGSFYLWGDVPALMPIVRRSVKVGGITWTGPHGYGSPGYVHIKGIPHRPTGHWTNPDENGSKGGGDWFGAGSDASLSSARKAASAHIAKIPVELARYIGRAWRPERLRDGVAAG